MLLHYVRIPYRSMEKVFIKYLRRQVVVMCCMWHVSLFEVYMHHIV